MNAISPVSSRVPYMVGQGNHEQDWYGTDTIGSGQGPELGRDSGGECGVPTSARFKMPSSPTTAPSRRRHLKKRFHDDPFWYSFDAGPVHIVMANTELPLNPPSQQWNWLVADLEAVERATTPWIVVMGHRPNFMQASIEALLWHL